MSYYKALPSCKEKILSWDREDFPRFAASMDQEEIRSMIREMFDECFIPSFTEDYPEAIVHDYILLLAFEAEMSANEEAAATLYEIIDAL